MQLQGWCSVLKPATFSKPSCRQRFRVTACSESPLAAGTIVRVKTSLLVYHVPKASPLDLKGWVGTVDSDVRNFKGEDLTANLPWKVRFEKPPENGSKPSKFFVHFKDDEIEVVTE